MGWLADLGSPHPVLLASPQGLPDCSLPPCRPGTDPPSPRLAARRGKKENRLQLAREPDLVPINPPRTPACPPSAFHPRPRPVHRGLGSARKVRQLFKDRGVRGGEVSQPGPDPAPVSSAVPSCALSITPDFDPELQSQLVDRGLRKGRPRIRSLPSGDRTLRPQQLPLFSSSLSRQVSEGVWGDTAELNVLSASTKEASH